MKWLMQACPSARTIDTHIRQTTSCHAQCHVMCARMDSLTSIFPLASPLGLVGTHSRKSTRTQVNTHFTDGQATRRLHFLNIPSAQGGCPSHHPICTLQLPPANQNLTKSVIPQPAGKASAQVHCTCPLIDSTPGPGHTHACTTGREHRPHGSPGSRTCRRSSPCASCS